jgi:hypothetical protein
MAHSETIRIAKLIKIYWNFYWRSRKTYSIRSKFCIHYFNIPQPTLFALLCWELTKLMDFVVHLVDEGLSATVDSGVRLRSMLLSASIDRTGNWQSTMLNRLGRLTLQSTHVTQLPDWRTRLCKSAAKPLQSIHESIILKVYFVTPKSARSSQGPFPRMLSAFLFSFHALLGDSEQNTAVYA